MRVSLLNAEGFRPLTWRMFILTSVLLALAVILWMIQSVPSVHAADRPAGVSVPSTPTVELGLSAAGAVEDTLKACLARIPKDASDGQRMIAEQGCQRDEGARKVSQINPHRIAP